MPVAVGQLLRVQLLRVLLLDAGPRSRLTRKTESHRAKPGPLRMSERKPAGPAERVRRGATPASGCVRLADRSALRRAARARMESRAGCRGVRVSLADSTRSVGPTVPRSDRCALQSAAARRPGGFWE